MSLILVALLLAGGASAQRDVEDPGDDEAALEVRLDALVEAMGSEDWAAREAATHALGTLVLEEPRGMLERLRARREGITDLEVRRRIDAVVGSATIEWPVMTALDWLAARQRADGGWGDDPEDARDVGRTALALIAYLGAGQTYQHGVHRETVKQGLRFLFARVAAGLEEAHPLDRLLVGAALAECYGSTQSPLVKPRALLALGLALDADDPASSWKGWLEGTEPHERDEILYWGALCLRSAEAADLGVPEAALRGLQARLVEGREGPSGVAWRAFAARTTHGERVSIEIEPPEPRPLIESSATLGRLLALEVFAIAPMQEAWADHGRRLETSVVDAQRRVRILRGSWDPSGEGPLEDRVTSTARRIIELRYYYGVTEHRSSRVFR